MGRKFRFSPHFSMILNKSIKEVKEYIKPQDMVASNE